MNYNNIISKNCTGITGGYGDKRRITKKSLSRTIMAHASSNKMSRYCTAMSSIQEVPMDDDVILINIDPDEKRELEFTNEHTDDDEQPPESEETPTNESSVKPSVIQAVMVVPKFNPEGGAGRTCSSVTQWLEIVEHLGEIHNWTDIEKMLLIYIQTDGNARTWFRNKLGLINSWKEWKDAMIVSFPESA